MHIQNPVNYCKFRHNQAYSCRIQTYSAIFWRICSSCIFRALPYLEYWHIETKDIIRTLSRHILVYIENPAIFRILAYLESGHLHSGTFRHIQ